MLVEPVIERAKKKKEEEEKEDEDWMEVEEGGKEKRKEIDLPGYSHGELVLVRGVVINMFSYVLAH